MSNRGLKSKFSIYAKMGLIPSTSVLEEKEKRLREEFDAFNEYKKSEELARFKELEAFVTSPEFRTLKKEINAQKYSGSEPFQKEQEYKKLKSSKRIKTYYQVKDSPALKAYEEFRTSTKLAEYEDLKQFYESPEFDEFKESLVQQKDEKTKEIKNKQDQYKTLKKQYRWFFKLKDSNTYANYKQLDGSPEIEEYFSLKESVDNNTDDQETIKQFKAKSKSSSIKKYLKFKNSDQYKKYVELEDSDEIKNFLSLEQEISSDGFKKHIEEVKNLVYKNTEEYQNYLKYKKLQKSPEVKQYYKFKDSAKFAIYNELEGSEEIAHFEDLERYIQSDEFIREKKYLNTKDKFKLSDEYKQQQEYLELKKSDKIKWFFKLDQSNIFDEIKKWSLTLEENFNAQHLDSKKWQTGYFWGKTLLEGDYVQANERQFFTDENILLDQGILKIRTQKQKIDGRVWHPVTGFYPKEFDFTSGLINTAQSFRQQYGLFKAKIKVDHSYPVHHAFWLRGEKITPEIDIFKYGKKSASKLEIANYWAEENTIRENRSVVAGVDFSRDYYIYSIEWTEHKITWKINDFIIHEQTKGIPDEPMYLLLSSGITQEGEPHLPSYMTVDWVRVYQENEDKQEKH